MKNFRSSHLYQLFVLLVSFSSANAAVPDIAFSTNGWSFTGSATSLEGASQVVTIVGNTSEYQTATIQPNFSTKPSTLYFVVDVYFDNYAGGSVSYNKAKLKAYSSTGNKSTDNIDPSTAPNKIWYTEVMQIDNFDTWSGTITFELGMQNCTGTYKTKNPHFMETPPTSTPYSFPWPVPADPTVTLNIHSSTSTPFNNNLLSTNSHFSWSSFSYDDTSLVRIVENELPMQNMRFPGGTVGNFYNWETDEYYDDSWTYASNSRKNLALSNWKFGFDGFATLSKSIGASSTLMFNMMEDDVTKSVNRFQDRISKGLNIEWIEMGNENFYSEQAYGYIADGDNVVSVSNYIAHTKALTTALKTIDPSVKISVGINDGNYSAGSWTDSISKENYYDATTVHSYFRLNGSDLTPVSGKAYLIAYKKTMDVFNTYHSHFPNTPAIVTEWGFLESPSSFLRVLGDAERVLAFTQLAKDGIVQQSGMHMLSHSDGYGQGQWIYKNNGKAYFTQEGLLFGELFRTFQNKNLYEKTVSAPQLETDVSSVLLEAVDFGDSIKVFAVNKLPVASPLQIQIDGSLFSGDYVMRSLHEDVTATMQEPATPYTSSFDGWVTENNTGTPQLPAYSVAVVSFLKPEPTVILNQSHAETIPFFIAAETMHFDRVENFEIFSVNGKRVLFGNKKEVKLNSLPAGNYFLKTESFLQSFLWGF